MFLFFQDLDKHSNFVKHTIIPDVHPDLIRQVQLIPDNRMIISSCANPNKSLVISDIKSLKKSYVFKNDKVSLILRQFCIKSVLQIRRGNWDNLGKIIHISP